MAEAIIAQQGTVDLWCRVHTVEPSHDTLVFGIAPRSIADPRFSTFVLPRDLLTGFPTWIELVRQVSRKLPNGEMTLVIEFDSREPSIRMVAQCVLDLVEMFDGKLNIIVLTDAELPDELEAVAVATNRLIVIPRDAPRLNPIQVASVLGLSADSDCARNLFALSDGVIGLLTFLEGYLERALDGSTTLKQSAMISGLPSLYAPVKNHLMREGVFDAVMRCAFLPEISEESAVRISGYQGCGRIITSLFQRFPVACLKSDGAGRLSWNVLFRKFLLDEAGKSFSAEHIDQLRHRASQLLTDARMVESLFLVHAEAGDWAAARAVICDYASELIDDGESGKLKDLLTALPDNVRSADPLLQYWLARTLLNDDLGKACKAFEGALQRFVTPGQTAQHFNCLSWTAIAASLMEGGSENVRNWLSRLGEILEWHGEEFGASSRILGLSAILQSCESTGGALRAQLSHYASELGELLSKQRFAGEIHLIAVIALLSYEVATGTVGVGAAIVREMDPLVSEDAFAFPLFAKWRLSVAASLRCAGEYEASLSVLDALQERLSEKGLDYLSAQCTWQRLLLLLDAGDPRASCVLEQWTPFAETSRHAVAAIGHKIAAIALSLKQGEPAKAMHAAQAAVSLAHVQSDTTMRFYASLALTHALIESGDWVSAMPIVERLLRDAEHLGDRPSQFYLQLSIARLAMERSDYSEMRTALANVFHSTRNADRFFNLFISPSTLSLLCTLALECGVPEEEVATAVLDRRVEPLADRLHERWPWRVRIYTLGAFRVVKDGQTIEFSGKAQRRPLDLLKVLIAYGGKSVDVNMVMGALWPDSQGDAAQKSFDTTLHRLRKLLADDVVTLTNRGVSLNPKLCWVDIWEFDQLASMPIQAQGSEEDGTGAPGRDADAMIDRVFQLYKGDFLCFEEEQQWIFAPADKFKSKFIRFVRKAGDLLEQQGDWSRAIEVYRRGIEVDNLSEDLYRALMESQRRGGSVADALETYRRCRQMLSVLLSIAPSERTTALYRQLTEQNQTRISD
jgi:DNA-binding SARP family transcriptional activator